MDILQIQLAVTNDYLSSDTLNRCSKFAIVTPQAHHRSSHHSNVLAINVLEILGPQIDSIFSPIKQCGMDYNFFVYISFPFRNM